MTNPEQSSKSYWDLIKTADRLLAEGQFPSAEQHYDVACARRESSPGRVFLTEKISDGLGRFFKRNQTGEEVSQGRWARHREEFRLAFLREGDHIVRRAVHLAELRPEDDAQTNQPILEQALYLVGRSGLFAEEPASAIPLLKGLFRTAKRTGRPFPVDLVRHDLPLTEEDRLWLARRGGELVVEFQEQETMMVGSKQAEEWARVCLQLLNPRYFGQTGRLEEERSWVEAMTADHLLGRAGESVAAYRNYLEEYPAPGERADEARIRMLELLANIDGLHFQVPHYDEALSAMQSAGLSPGSAMAGRYGAALGRMEHRRPDPEPGQTGNYAWASLALESDGRVAAVFWWGDEPRDVAYWRPGEDPAHIRSFLVPCEDRLICAQQSTLSVLAGVWDGVPAPWTVNDFVSALLEVNLPSGGLDPESLLRMGMGETGPWRSGWNPDHGHVQLEPPRRSTLTEAWQGGPAGSSLVAGLLLLAIRTRLATADPCLRGGIRQLARRGDPASSFLYEFLTVGSHVTAEVDATFEPWTLPLLWTRPDPFGWSSQGSAASETTFPSRDSLARPDLGRNDVAIVSTGDPAAVVAAWGDGRQKWRIVLDRLDRLDSLSRVAGGAIGPVTLIPQSGMVHDLDGALALLEQMLTPEQRPTGQVAGLLPLFHWTRLVETHNGDLLDFMQVRPRIHTDTPLYDQYFDLTGELPRTEPRLDEAGRRNDWTNQFSQRVRKAGFVAGMVDSLIPDAARLDSLWGVFEGSDASWVFLDSAAVHWSLLGRESAGIQELHTLMHSRGRRHLSLLTGAIWQRSELEELLGTWLGVFGTAYCVGLTDGRPPRLRLADRGLIPDSKLDPVQALGSQLTYVRQVLDGENGGTILLPGEGCCADFWLDIASGQLELSGNHWHFLSPARRHSELVPGGRMAANVEEIPDASRQTLLVPVLASLEEGESPIALSDSPADWESADRNRRAFLDWRRKLCGLEIASLMAGTWQNVEIMDPRWWRLLRPDDGSLNVPWTGALAGAVVSPDGMTTFDLPGLGRGKDDLLPTSVVDSISQWFRSRPADFPVPDVLPDPLANLSLTTPQLQLLVGDSGNFWARITKFMARQWDQGDLGSWALLVSDKLPGPTADLVASSWTSGISAWPLDAEPGLPGPVLWINRDDFANPAFVEYLNAHPPTVVMACGVQDWLPKHDDGGQIGAHAMRLLLDCNTRLLVLQADELTEPWRNFLQETTGVELVSEASPQPGDSSECEPVFPGSTESLQRLRQLLTRLELVLSAKDEGIQDSSQTMVSARQLVSARWLSCLAGVSEQSIRQGVRVLRWAGRLQGDSLSASAGQLDTPMGRPITHALLIPTRFAQLEHQLLRLEDQLPILLPLFLGHHRPGLSTWIDLAYPPVECESQDLLLLDCYLSMVAASPQSQLVYDSPSGGMHTSRRLLACEGNPVQVLSQLVASLGQFRDRVKEVMSGAVETGNGYLVDTGLSDLRDDERDFLATGAAMGLWRWMGPMDDKSMHLVDLLTLAESPTVRSRSSAWNLLEALSTGEPSKFHAPLVTTNSEGDSSDASSGWGFGGLRNLLPGSTRQDAFSLVIQKISSLVIPDGKQGHLVLKGCMGSGRHEAIAAALTASVDGLEVTVYCPDTESAAVMLEAAGPLGAHFLGDIRIAEKGITPAAPRTFDSYLANTPNSLVIMCEVQRFEKETRYRIAQMGRGRKLLMTIDPVANVEPWENLFLTIPGSEQIIELNQPRRSARKLWTQVNELLPELMRGTVPSLRADKGSIIADYAVNLDQCLARLVLDVESRDIPDRLRLIGPLLSDLDFLAESIRQRGWLAIPENTLAPLLLPGTRELLAVATDLLARGMTHTQENAEEAEGLLLTPRMLPGGAVDQWASWYQDSELDLASLSMADFFHHLETEPWARSFLSHPAALERILKLLESWAEESVAVLAGTALWEAWWLTTLAHLGVPLPDERRPLVTLAESSSPAGIFAPGGLYLCLGSENWRQHYNVLGRVTDQSLVLYKERSPLESEGPVPR